MLRYIYGNKRFFLIIYVIVFSFLLSLTFRGGTIGGEPLKRIEGIYSLIPPERPIPKKIIEKTNIIGLSLRVWWNRIEPEEGRYDWRYMDREINKAKERNKLITLRIMAGVHSPLWLYEKGVKRFEFIDRNIHHSKAYRGERATFGKRLSIPIPWNETFMGYWLRLISEIGRRYKDIPEIVIIHATGPNRHSAEMVLPRDPDDRKNWKLIGYSPELLIDAWKRSIDAWADAFPLTYISLNLSPVIFNDGVMEEIVRYGYERYGRRFLLQNNALTDNFGQRRKDFGLIREYSSKLYIGFQMLATSSNRIDKRQGDLKRSIDHGLLLGARYFEIYPRDILRQGDVIDYANQRIRTISPEPSLQMTVK